MSGNFFITSKLGTTSIRDIHPVAVDNGKYFFSICDWTCVCQLIPGMDINNYIPTLVCNRALYHCFDLP